jgi:hypothetical protein
MLEVEVEDLKPFQRVQVEQVEVELDNYFQEDQEQQEQQILEVEVVEQTHLEEVQEVQESLLLEHQELLEFQQVQAQIQ